jgi:homopolymeric O-antigen transport system ATP-binding protein
MSETMIEVNGLGKCYRRGGQQQAMRDLRESLLRAVTYPFRKKSDSAEKSDKDFWALRDVSFTVKRGEVMGVIGGNGAGKSTLLKILSRITRPSEGQAILHGRVGSLLEVGTGFHPELTGRENVFFSGAVLGMKEAEIKSQFDEIVDFSGVEEFLDTPVKHYSSGMRVRLGFAVAAHLNPEILLVDEVLAVGDAAFQNRCLGKMSEVAKSGRTVLFVSHNMGAVSGLCRQGLVLEQGKVSIISDVKEAVAKYLKFDRPNNLREIYQVEQSDPDSCVQLRNVSVLSEDDETTSIVKLDSPFSLACTWLLSSTVPFLRVGFDIKDKMGVVVLSTMDTDSTDLQGRLREPGLFREVVRIPGFLLMPGVYTVRLFIIIPKRECLLDLEETVMFEIVDGGSHLSKYADSNRRGYISTPLEWEVAREAI